MKKYLEIQMNLLVPKDNGIDPVAPPSKRLLDLQKLMFIIDDLPNLVPWKIKERKEKVLLEKKK